MKVAKMYEDGTGTEVNNKSAFKWYLTAANLGNAETAEKVSSMYKNGQGVKKSMSRSKRWHKKATSLRNK